MPEKQDKSGHKNEEKELVCSMRGISKVFGRVKVIEDIKLDVYAGEVHALMGENGAGKSTLMKILCGLYTKTEGTVELFGKEVEFHSIHDSEAAGIGLVPQEIDLFPELSVTENLFVGRKKPRTKLGVFDWGRMHEEARAVFKRLGVEIDVTKLVKVMSMANCQLIEIARALLRDARIMIFDESTASLTDPEIEQLFRVIRDLKTQNVGIIYISHRMDEIFQICDRITVLRDGQWIACEKASDLDYDQLVKLMIGRSSSQLFTREKSEPGEVLLEIENLSSGNKFRDVSFELRAGEVVGLAGLVGAGRSEIAQTIFGILKKDSGKIKLRGKEVSIDDPGKAMDLGIAYLPEERRSQGLILPISIRRNITLASLKKISKKGLIDRKREKELASNYISTFSIRGATLDKPVIELSGGNQQKVVISKILAREPDILLIDEPTRGIDIGAKSEIYKLIDELAQQGKAILMISSELTEVISLSDRVVVMYEGRKAGEFAREEITQEKIGAASSGLMDQGSAVDEGGVM
ncbi:sugar ABC transporter ATP-binding protein [Lactonifactor longoviformis]|uniref:sugar ABC transporter ATP-binding protein n=1 Tax=Lactonifactor longoviformis TaxID=341220 RepID=UPI0036F431A5